MLSSNTKPNATSSSSSSSQIYPNPPLQYHQLPSHPIVIDRMNLYQQAHVAGGQTAAPVSKLLACQRSPGLGANASTNQQTSSGTNRSTQQQQMYNSRNDESSQNYFNLGDNAFSDSKNNNTNSDYHNRLQLLPNQPKVLNSAGVPVTSADGRYHSHQQQQQQHQSNTPTYSPSSVPAAFHSKVAPTDSTSATSGYSSSSSLNSGQQPQQQQQQHQQLLQQQNSTSSLASTNSSPSSSPYPRHLLHSNGATCLPALLESASFTSSSNGPTTSGDSSQQQQQQQQLLPQSTTAAYMKLLAASRKQPNGSALLHQSRSASAIPNGVPPSFSLNGFTVPTPPPPPLPPHRTAANAPTPPPIPPHNNTSASASACNSTAVTATTTTTTTTTATTTSQAINSSSSHSNHCDSQQQQQQHQQQPQQLSLSTASLVSAVANNPQLQQYIREHMNAAVNGTTTSGNSAVSANNQVVLRSKSQPQIRGSPQPPHLRLAAAAQAVQAQFEQQSPQFTSNGHPTGSDHQAQSSSVPNNSNCLSASGNDFSPQRNTSPISFGRARLKAAAMAAAEQHQHHQELADEVPTNNQQQAQPLAQNDCQTRASVATNSTSTSTSSPSVSSAQMNEKLLAAQVAQRLQNLHLSRLK